LLYRLFRDVVVANNISNNSAIDGVVSGIFLRELGSVCRVVFLLIQNFDGQMTLLYREVLGLQGSPVGTISKSEVIHTSKRKS
jgi:hypothetical protein